MRTVGLTGNVASGKSAVAEMWAEEGVPVVSADDLARQVVEPGSAGLRAVVESFGSSMLRLDGTLNRARLRERVFRDPGERRRLERILHPRIAEARARWEEERRREGHALVVAEIPLLFESGLEGDVDVTVVVDAPAEERLRRLVEDRGLGADEARRIMDAQMDPAEKRRRADHVLENDGTLEELDHRARELLRRLRAEC